MLIVRKKCREEDADNQVTLKQLALYNIINQQLNYVDRHWPLIIEHRL